MKYYKVLKDLINAPIGITLSNREGQVGLYKRGDNRTVLTIYDIEDAVDQGFIEEYSPEPKGWRAKYGGTFYFILAGSILEAIDNYTSLESRYYSTGNYFKSKLTAQKVIEAENLFFKYLHIIPGTPQQNIKNDFEKAHAEARKAVLKDNEGVQ